MLFACGVAVLRVCAVRTGVGVGWVVLFVGRLGK